MSKFYFDSSFLNSASGIGRDNNFLAESLASQGYELQFVDPIELKFPRVTRVFPKRLIRTFLMVFCFATKKLLFFELPTSGIYIQGQVFPLIPSNSQKLFVRLHDIFPIAHKNFFRLIPRQVFRNTFLRFAEIAYFIVNSQTTRKTVESFSSNIIVHPCGSGIYTQLPCNHCQGCLFVRSPNKRRFFLAVGTVEPRKNYPFLISAYLKSLAFTSHEIELVIVGRLGWKYWNSIHYMHKNGKRGVRWIKDACDGSLLEIYKTASLFISASLDEGFDIPSTEAFNNGLPLLLSDIGVHRELFDYDRHFFFDPRVISQLINCINSFLSGKSQAGLVISMPKSELGNLLP